MLGFDFQGLGYEFKVKDAGIKVKANKFRFKRCNELAWKCGWFGRVFG